MPGIGQLGKSGPADKACPRQQLFDQRAHGRCTQQHGFIPPAAMQNPVGKNVSAFEVARQLDLIDRQERGIYIFRHGLYRAHPIARAHRDDLFLTRDQRHRRIANRFADPVVNFARQQPQRQSDHATGRGNHALHSQMGLARIGWTKHGGDRF